MVAKIKSIGLHGIRGFMSDVETYAARGIPEFNIIGLGSASVREAARRVPAAIRNQGYELTPSHITVNLAPSSIKKEGTSFDLAIAVSILCAMGFVRADKAEKYVFIGELALDGTLRGIDGVLAMVTAALREGYMNIIVPAVNAAEASLVENVTVWGIESLRNIHEVLCNDAKPYKRSEHISEINDGYPQSKNDEILCFSQVIGQQSVKRALEIAASGGHNILMLGAAGSGKTMMSRRMLSILPQLTQEEAYDVTTIYSVCGMLPKEVKLIKQRPFREIHSDITRAALIGGGRPPVPGEISLSHKGILFLDEMTQLDKSVTDSLRQPLESGEITLMRVGGAEVFPADFMLVGAANPCRCGLLFEGGGQCRCTPNQISANMSRLSAPILDRIDIHIPVRRTKFDDTEHKERGETSETIRKRVVRVREIQAQRYRNSIDKLNAKVSQDELDKYTKLTTRCRKLLNSASEQMGLSMRGYGKMLRIARTLADMAAVDDINEEHIAEAISYRFLDKLQNGGNSNAI